MALTRSIGARKDATRGTTALEVRKGLAGLVTGAGVLPGGSSPLVTGSAGWQYTVKAAKWVTSRGASDGVHLWGNDGDILVGSSGVGGTVTAAPGAGLSRIDIIYALHPSNGENSDTTSEPTVAVAVGTPGSPGLAPSIPTGALELARNTMTSSATTTASSGNTITQSAAVAYLVGTEPVDFGTVEVVDSIGVITGAYSGQPVKRRYRTQSVTTDGNGDFILMPGSAFSGGGVLGASVHAFSTLDLVFAVRILSGNLVCRVYSTAGTAVASSSFNITAEITYWTA